ncbi:DNA-binding protein [Halobellus salinus]|uniref:DNA-binding protein n=1 Tax=Halobellus salinus TaxID=931585 RepID=A0A830ELZ7_9EURY|nr:HalX domain-containing protein [Halobellus salinus]GGJ03892.1 DNA-binding protein [Halobellus salinus]SMP20820.1 Response regulator receiver domain-containing protein [Halobellus salinus]
MDGPTPQVLIVEDETDLADLYGIYLSDRYEVQTANDGETAMELVSEDTDIVLLDRRMPDMTGDEVLAEIRDRGIDCRVAMITAVEPDLGIVEMPFDDYLVKPVTREDLRGLVEVLLRRSGYDSRTQEFFQLASKKAALESTPDVSVDEESEYQELTDRMTELREDLDQTLSELTDDDFRQAFASLPGEDAEFDDSADESGF